MDIEATQYTRIEYERRFLVSSRADWKSVVEPYSKTFEDKYLHNTRLRLRRLTDSDTGRQLLKLTRKPESPSPYFRTIGRLLLSENEYALLSTLEGSHLQKTRFYHHYRGRVFSIDVFDGELAGLFLCEVEAEGLDELMTAEPPPYVQLEVTEDEFFTGGNLCRITRDDLLRKLSTMG